MSQPIDHLLLKQMTTALAPSLPAARSDNVHYLAAPACDVPDLPADQLTPQEVALFRRLLPKLLSAASGACPILSKL